MDIRVRAEALSRTESEIRSEMASALGRIGRMLEDRVTRLKQLHDEIAGDRRNGREKIQEYRVVREQARLYFWYLIVQRESIGLRDHKSVFETYRIPGMPVG